MKLKWRMKGGETIYFRDMTDSHLKNSLRCLLRAANVQRWQMLKVSQLFGGNPDTEASWQIAQMEDRYLEMDEHDMAEDFYPDEYEALCHNLEKRGVDPFSVTTWEGRSNED